MADVNTTLADAAVRHAIGLQRYTSGELRRMMALLNRVDADIAGIIQKYDPTDVAPRYAEQRLEKMLVAIRELNAEVYDAFVRALSGDMRELAAYEAEFQARMIQDAIPVEFDVVKPAPAQVRAAAMARPFQGRLLKDWGKDLQANAFAKVRDNIRIGFVEGETIDQMVRRIRGTRANQYKDGVLEINRRNAEALVRTAVAHTANSARADVYAANDDIIKGVRWVSTLDGRTSAVCRGRDGTVYPIDKGPRPPAHWNCLPGDAPISSRAVITGASKRWFDGQLIVIRTAAGHEITCTPNHPILTDRGWVAAQAVDLGCKVICDLWSKRPTAAINGNHQDMPTRIEEVANTFLGSEMMLSVPMPTSAEDFHGDGIDGEIAIVGSNRLLEASRNAALLQHRGNLPVVMRDATLARFAGISGEAEFFAAAYASDNRLVREVSEALAFVRRCSVHAGLLLGGSATQLNAGFGQDALNGTWRDAEFYRNAANAPTGEIFADDVVGVERRDFRGHVYNLETENGMFSSGGIVTHNCRSTTVPVLKTWREMGIDADDAPPSTRSSMNGQVPDTETYDSWLRKQPREFQDEVLGRTKAQLFRAGLTLPKFLNRRGDELSLDELRRKEAEYFKRAGV